MNTYRLNSLAALAVAALIGGCALAPYENPIEAINYSSDHVALAVKGQYRSIAVLPFKNDSPYETADEFARRTFVAQLTSHKSYDVQRTSHTDARLKDLTRAAIDQKNWQELESAVNADMLVFGHVLEGDDVLDLITRIDPQQPSAIAFPDDPVSRLAEQGVNLPGDQARTVGDAVRDALGTSPVSGQSFTVAGYRGVLGTVGGREAYGFYVQPDVIEEVIVGARPAAQ